MFAKNQIILNNSNRMPSLGLGTWKTDRDKVGQAVKYAVLNCGYRHIDCASIYENEKEIGEAFEKIFSSGNIKRGEIFVTSKLWSTDHHPQNVEKACRKTLADLKLDYLDLYLVHWGIALDPKARHSPLGKDETAKTEPVSTQETWQAMEALIGKGLVKSIGISNFTTAMIIDLLSYARIKPVANQIEIHPYNSQEELVAYCHKKGIAITAYSPLGSSGKSSDQAKNKPIRNKTVIEIANAHQKTPAQVLIRWSLQRGLVVIPKSINEKHISENINVRDFELSEGEMSQINKLNKNYRFVNPLSWWGIPYFD